MYNENKDPEVNASQVKGKFTSKISLSPQYSISATTSSQSSQCSFSQLNKNTTSKRFFSPSTSQFQCKMPSIDSKEPSEDISWVEKLKIGKRISAR